MIPIPLERDLESDEAVLDLYHRWCLHHEKHRTPEEMTRRFNDFKKSAIHVFEMNKNNPACQFYMSSYCDEKDLLDKAARKVALVPMVSDLESDEAVWALYHRWCLHHDIHRTPEEMRERFKTFKESACSVFELNIEYPNSFALSPWCDGNELCCGMVDDSSSDGEGSSSSDG